MTKPIMVRLPQEIVNHIDALALKKGISRAQLIRYALLASDERSVTRGFALSNKPYNPCQKNLDTNEHS